MSDSETEKLTREVGYYETNGESGRDCSNCQYSYTEYEEDEQERKTSCFKHMLLVPVIGVCLSWKEQTRN